MKDTKTVLMLSFAHSPNLGGVETHLDDLEARLDKEGYSVCVLTFRPLVTKTDWLPFEKKGNHIEIHRMNWFGQGWFETMCKHPLLLFLWLIPYYCLRIFFFMLHSKIDVVHAHGAVATTAALMPCKIFKKYLVVTIHNHFEFAKHSASYRNLYAFIFNRCDKIFTFSGKSFAEFKFIGVEDERLERSYLWADIDLFHVRDKEEMRNRLNLPDGFTVIFVGRFLEIKGPRTLLEVARELPHINFLFVGDGEIYLELKSAGVENALFVGRKTREEVAEYLSAADLFCLPSRYEEGVTGVLGEALASGLPVVGSNMGSIYEGCDESVAILVEPNGENLKQAIETLYNDPEGLDKMRKNARPYAETHLNGEINSMVFIKGYGFDDESAIKTLGSTH